MFIPGGRLVPSTMAQEATPRPSGEAVIATPTSITGTILFPADVPEGSPADITIRLEDVSRADAPAIILASITLDEIPVPPPAGEQITFSLPVASFDPLSSYTVRVHVDRDQDGWISKGDLLTTSHIPVLTRGGGTEVQVPVEIV
jgi:putative lipoprotein